ncbi:MAG: glycosyltransferase [Pseudomonadota bacterium]
MTHRPIRVGFFLRHQRSGFHSIEKVFQTVAEHMSDDIEIIRFTTPYPSKGIVNRLKAIFWARRAFHDEKIEVAHILGDEHFLCFGLPRKKTVLTIHDLNVIDAASGLRKRALALLWAILPVYWCQIITTISRKSAQQIMNIAQNNGAKIVVIENPLPVQMRVPKEDRLSNTILQIGTKENKNIERLISAVKGLDVRLAIVGPLSTAQKDLLASNGVTYENHVDISDAQLEALYEKCGLVSFVSLNEGFGMPIIEGQAASRPVIVSDRSPMREVAGEGVVLADPLNVDSIRLGIERLLSDKTLRAQTIANGRQNVARYDPPTIAHQYADIYRSLLGEERQKTGF